jgi:two-component system, chemotaxis family, response regulator Rcp1
MDGRPIQILMIEDNDGDVALTTEALRAAKIHNRLDVAHDGVEGMEYLRRKGTYAAAPRPDLILLDLSLPRKDGREVLAELKADAELRAIPVVVLTSSTAEQDVARSYDLHVNCYVVKPVDFSALTEIVKAISHFWFTVVKLPHPSA